MMNDQPLLSGPYSHNNSTVPKVMFLVMLALLPASLFGLYLFGWPAIFLFFITILSAVLAEAVSLKLSGKPVGIFLMDGSAILTGWLLAMTLPPWAPWWIGVLGGMLAIIIGKQVFGGIGQNLFNPAMVARVALLISFPLEMTLFTHPAPLFASASPNFHEALAITFGGAGQLDGFTGATVLNHIKTELGRGIDLQQAQATSSTLWQMVLGNTGGSLGETSTLLILAGGIFLLYKRIISWHIPLSMLSTVFILASIFHLLEPQSYVGPLTHIMSGAVLLGAFFIATDLVTSPVSIRGQLLFGSSCGLLVYVIRTWAGYPEGVAFAVMLMNAFTPLIDHYLKPRIYGRDRKGQPIVYDNNLEDKI